MQEPATVQLPVWQQVPAYALQERRQEQTERPGTRSSTREAADKPAQAMFLLPTYASRFSYSADANFEAYLTSQGFPESYKDGLRQLHTQYPNWVFRAKNTGIDWNTAIENESVLGRNLVATGSISSWKSVESGAYNWDNSTWTGFDGSNWVAASQDIIRYYMDPRNFFR